MHAQDPPPIALLTAAQVERLAAAAAVDALRRTLPAAIKQATTKPYLTKAELMELTGWSSRQVEYKKSKRELSYVKRGRLVLFPSDEVFAYLEAGRVPAR